MTRKFNAYPGCRGVVAVTGEVATAGVAAGNVVTGGAMILLDGV